MCAYSFTVFVSVFQLLPTAPYHIIDLGGTTASAGLFLGSLTYSSALSAPLTGTVGDRVGQRRVLLTVSLVLAFFSASYALITNIKLMLAVVFVHGLFWSALLSASGAYMTGVIPVARRAEGIGYWGLTSALSVAVAPPLGFWVYHHGWRALCIELVTLNLLMAFIAWRLPPDGREVPRQMAQGLGSDEVPRPTPHAPSRVEWRVLGLSVAMGVISFGYGGLTSFSALFADELHVSPRSLFLTLMAVAILTMRLLLGRRLDAIGHRRVLLPCFAAPAVGLVMLAGATGPMSFGLAAVAFGVGFGLMYPAYTAYVMQHVAFERRGAAFGAMLAAFDTGVGSGSSVVGWLIQHVGFRAAFAIAGGVAALSLPYFLIAERRLRFKSDT
jgi:MFS family permease